MSRAVRNVCQPVTSSRDTVDELTGLLNFVAVMTVPVWPSYRVRHFSVEKKKKKKVEENCRTSPSLLNQRARAARLDKRSKQHSVCSN